MQSDETTINRFRQGDDNAFEQVVRSWEDRALNFFYRAVGDMDTAKDLRQDLFIRLYRYRGSYRGDGRFVSWFYSIAANVLREHFRKARSFISAVDPDADSSSAAQEIPDGGPTVDRIAERNERARLVRAMVAALSEKDREVLTLRFFGGLRFEEIAKALGIGESAAKVRAIRALERLRVRMAERGLSADDLL